MPGRPDGPASDVIAAPHDRLRGLAAILSSVFGVGLAYGALIPLITLRLARDGVGELMIGVVGATFPIASLTVSPLIPHILSRFGTVRVLATSLAAAVIGVLLFPLWTGVGPWMALRFLTGAAGTVHWVVSETWLNSVATGRDRGRIMSLYATVFAGGFALGPFLIGQVGIMGALPFVVIALAVGLAGAPLVFARGLASRIPVVSERGLVRIASAAPFVMAAAVCAGAFDSAVIVFLPLYALDVGLEEHIAANLLSAFIAGNVLLQLPLGWLGDRFGHVSLLLLCAAGALVGSLFLPFLIVDGASFDAWSWAFVFVWGGFGFGLYTMALALLGERYALAELAVANAAFVMIYEMGSFAGPILAGATARVAGGIGLVWTAAVAAALVLLAAPWSRRRGPTSS